MLLIYTHKITPRVTYITRQVFSRILGIEIGHTTAVEDFIKHKGPKITYTRQPLQNEFFIQSSELLFQQGIEEVDIQMATWEDLPCFFSSAPRSNVPFDILAASFYLLSRYEEYLPHVRDQHGRFPPAESIAYQHDFLRLPLVDLWANKLLDTASGTLSGNSYRSQALSVHPYRRCHDFPLLCPQGVLQGYGRIRTRSLPPEIQKDVGTPSGIV